MTLVEVQRYARQILVRDVGRGGQEALLAATVPAQGSGQALDAAVELLEAAGVRVARAEASAPAELAGRLLGPGAYVDRRAACPLCAAAFFAAQPLADQGEDFAVAFGLGALIASEVLLSILDAARPPLAMTLVPSARVVNPVRKDCTCRS